MEPWRAWASLAWPVPMMWRGSSVKFRAISSETRIATAAPSVMGEQSKSFMGHATVGFAEGSLRNSISSVQEGTGCPLCLARAMRDCMISRMEELKWAFGFKAPLSWFFMATLMSCSSVVPYLAMWAVATWA
jgi:hypothetical protein